jgi:hypothetical protein
MMGATEKGGIL